MEIHDAANIYPLDEENLPGLADDIKRNGLLDEIETLDGKVIDGRRRLAACRMAGVEPRFVAIPSGKDAIAHVVSKQNRRDLDKAQRATAAARAESLREKLSQEAKVRQREAGGDRKSASAKSVVEHVPQPIQTAAKARDELGKMFGISGRLIDHAKKVLAKGEPEVIKAVDGGRLAVTAAARLVDKPAEIQVREAKKADKPRQRSPTPAQQTAPALPKKQQQAASASPSTGAILLAHEAINDLMKIRSTDPRRAEAFGMVARWIRIQLKTKPASE